MEHNWRPEALSIIEEAGFTGQVFVPLPEDGQWVENYEVQADWELDYLEQVTIILFWVPRHMEHLPAFTTNVEFGMFCRSGRAVLGYPKDAPKMKYLEHLACRFELPPTTHTLGKTIAAGFRLLRKRTGR